MQSHIEPKYIILSILLFFKFIFSTVALTSTSLDDVHDFAENSAHTIHRVWVKYQSPPTYPFNFDDVLSDGSMTIPIVEPGNPFLSDFFTSENLGTTALSGNRKTDNTDFRRTAEAYCHPQSPHRGDPVYRDRLLFLLDTIMHPAREIISTWDEQDIPFGYGLLKENFPNDLTTELEERCDRILRNTSLNYFEFDEKVWDPITRLSSWYNGQANVHSTHFLIGVALQNDTIQYIGESFFDIAFTHSVLQDNGAIDYTGLQNDVFTYRGFSISALGRYYIVSQNQEMLPAWKKMTPYYPISVNIGPTGLPMGEYYTAAFWKHYWNMSGPGQAYFVAALTNDPYNMHFAQLNTHYENAYFYKENLVQPVAQPTSNYTIYDANIEGPRARYGDFGFAATARVVDNYPNHISLGEPIGAGVGGKSTIVGAHLIKESGASFIYNSIIDQVGLEIKSVAGEETEYRRNKYLYLTTNERSSTTNSLQLYGLTSSYNPSRAFVPEDWIMHEQWVFMPERLVGHLTVNSLIDNQEAYAVGSIVKLVSGRNWWGDKKDIVDLGNGHYTFGRMHFIIKEQNLNGNIITEYGPEYAQTTASMSEKQSFHRMLDGNNQAGVAEQLFTYDINEKFYYTIEIFEDGTVPASLIATTRNNDMHTLTVDDGQRKVKSVMNISDNELVHQDVTNANYTMAAVLRSWFPDEMLDKNEPLHSFQIPAHQSLLLIESSNNNDLNLVENYYPDLFPASNYCYVGGQCDDGLSCTTNDRYTANCVCEGNIILDPIAYPAYQCNDDYCWSAIASDDNGHIATNTLDQDLSTYWEADANEYIEYCLDEVTVLQAISIAFHRGDEQTLEFDVEVSIDGENWTSVLCNASSNGTTTDVQSFNFKPIQAKKIRITAYGASDDNMNALTEVQWHPAIYLEAENANIVADWVVESNDTASASAYVVMHVYPADPSPTVADALSYDFTISSTGDYHIWARTLAPNSNDDSFWIKVDDGDWRLWHVSRSPEWLWSKILNETYSLTEGIHRLYVHYRENGTKLDKLCISETNAAAPIDPNVISADFIGVYFEAECATPVGVWEIETDANASAGGYVVNNALTNSSPSESTSLVYDFSILTAGDYNIWTRTITPNGNDNSFWVKVDDADWQLWSVPIKSTWGWDKLLNQSYALAAGAHRLYVHYRENGAKLDKLYIASEEACTPIGVDGDASNCLPVCTAGTFCDDGNDCTYGDVYDNNCNCIGIADDSFTGMPCDDGDPCTIGTSYSVNCQCDGGQFQDADNDGVCDAEDICLGGDDNIDLNNDGVPDACQEDCIDDIIILENTIITENDAAHISIATSGTVPSGMDVKHNAGSYVELLPQFEVEQGAVYHAFIAPCESNIDE